MKRKIAKVGLVAFALMLSAAAAQATIISSINMEVRNSGYTVLGTDDPTSLLAQFALGSSVCDVSLDALDLVGSSQTPTCGGPTTNIATLFSLHIAQDGVVLFEFGADWGLGGIAFLTSGTSGDTGALTDDYWWNLDWNNSDVIGFGVPATGSFTGSYTLNLLGFEGCCGGAMSLRYSDDYGETWQIATVNGVRPIPEPSTLALLGLGLLGMGLVSRRKA